MKQVATVSLELHHRFGFTAVLGRVDIDALRHGGAGVHSIPVYINVPEDKLPASNRNWQLAEAISDEPAVHEAIQTFSEDHTGDNATGIVLAVMNAYAARLYADCMAAAKEGKLTQMLEGK